MVNATTLHHLRVTPYVDYARLYIRVEHSTSAKASKDSVSRLRLPFPKTQTLLLDKSADEIPYCCAPEVKLQFPPPEPTADASHLVIGLATTLSRLEKSLSSFAHWGGNTGARFFAYVPPPTTKSEAKTNGSARIKEVESHAKALGLHLEVRTSDLEYNDRYFMLLKFLHVQKKPSTKWAVIMDDDTFFLSMPALLRRLEALNHNDRHYLGGLSEDLLQIHNLGPIGFGGAGVFVSLALLDEMQPYLEVCLGWGEKYPTGDSRIAACILEATGVQLDWEKNLHQLDMHGDASGFFESGRPLPLSVHHWKSWFWTPMDKVSAVSKVCGDNCLLRRWRFEDGWYLTNGYSIVKYWDEKEWVGKKSETIEKTWWEEFQWDGRWDHSLGPLRPKDERKASMKLEEAIVEKNRVRQIYVRRGDAERNDRIMEIVWEKEDNPK